ncbi:MAG TPA: potassium channel family protein [Thermoplasmata archaeon]|nr:potassium channel family protein [Thermoplasmata archaeon]
MGKFTDWWLHLRLRNTVALGSGVLLVLVALCTLVVHFVEGWTWVDSVYFSIASITTVGYGDLAPAHEATKLFLIVYLPLGIGVGFTVLTAVGARILEAQRRRLERAHVAMGEHEEPRAN